MQRIGIMGAMPEEIEGIVDLLTDRTEEIIGKRIYYNGKLFEIPTTVVFSRWGKVAAATTASTLIQKYKISELIFTGVAGAIDPRLKIGDIVLGERLIQHDMDARPLMNQYEIPLLGKTYFETDSLHLKIAEHAISDLISEKRIHQVFSAETLDSFNIKSPRLFVGDIASGDQFIADDLHKENLHSQLPTTLCVEMEGAAVAQVCYEYEIPFLIIRTISDEANNNSHIDFPRFIKNISSKYSIEIIKNIYQSK